MNYLAFSRKYRPRNFNEIVGQEHIATTLKNAIANNCVHHAYLFCGSRGVGKTSTARIFAKAINCPSSQNGISCDNCLICERIATGDDMDVLEIDGASNRGIEEIRNIKNDIKYLPSQAKYKIFIIDEVHMLTQAAFNALLKTLEEPPSHVKFIFATTQVFSIPDTIISRCQRFDFHKISVTDVISQLEKISQIEEIEVGKEVLEQIAYLAKGAMRDSLVLLDQLHSFCGKKIDIQSLRNILGNDKNYSFQLLEAIQQKDIEKTLHVVDEFCQGGGDPANCIDLLAQHFRDILVLLVSKDGDKYIEGTEQYFEDLHKIKNYFSTEYIMQAIQYISTLKTHLQRGFLGKILLETVLIKIIHIESLLPLEDMVNALVTLNKTLPRQQLQPMASPDTNRAPIRRNELKPVQKTVSENPFLPTPNPEQKKNNTPLAQAPLKKEPIAQTPLKKETSKDTKVDIFFKILAENSNNIANILKEGKISFQNDVLSIELDAAHKITVDMLNKKNNTILNEVAKKVGVSVRVHCFEDKKKDNRSLEQDKSIVENDPVVSLCLELFNGRIVKIEPTNA